MRFLFIALIFMFTSCARRAIVLPAPAAVKMPTASTEEIGRHIDDMEKNVLQASARVEKIKKLLDNLYEK
jgi:hypothetical protein